MLKVYFGNDTVKARQAAWIYLEGLRGEGKAIETIDANNYQSGILNDATASASLFGETAYLLDEPATDAEMSEDVLNSLPAMAASEKVFVVIEGAMLAPLKKKYEKHAESMEEFKAATAERFNNFLLAEALARRDKKGLWLTWHEARLRGAAPEELFGILWWQIKTLRLAALTKSAEEAGLKDYPYQKAKRSLAKFKEGELETLSRSLLTVMHDSRLGLSDLEISMERWMLGI